MYHVGVGGDRKWVLFTEQKKDQGRNANSSGKKGDFHFHICKHEY